MLLAYGELPSPVVWRDTVKFFRPAVNGRGGRYGKMKVGIVIDGTTVFGREVFRGFRLFANTREQWTVFEDLRGQREAPAEWPAVDGLIIAGTGSEALRRKAGMVVHCCESSMAEPKPLVCVDDHQAGVVVAEHLLTCVLKHFAFYGEAKRGLARLGGFEARLAAAHFTCHLAPQELFENGENRQGGRAEALTKWIKSLPKPAGIFAWNDAGAREVASACKDAGIGVPDEVAIIGVNNDELLCESAWPPLSSLSVDFTRLGTVAAQMLDRMLKGEELAEEGKVYILPGGVVRRQSTDILAVDDPDIARAVAVIRERACGSFTVKDLLKSVPLIRRTLERRFVEKLGRTPYEEITRVRMELAQQLLRETDETLPSVAQRCGFCAPQALNYMFRKVTGQTPAAYRRLYRSDRG